MGFRLFSGKWHFAAAIVVAPAMALGYYAGDPENLGISVNATLSGAGSVHGRHIPSSGAKTAHPKIAREAAHLFAGPHKGPRADRYVMLTRSRKGLEPEPKITKATVLAKAPIQADMTVTGSIPKQMPLKVVSLANQTAVPRTLEPIDNRAKEFGLLPAIPVAERTSVSLFLSSVALRTPTHFPEFANSRIEPEFRPGPVKSKISRGLTFKGESENEYQVRQRRCLATAIYFEARGEPTRGQLAVAQVVMNRVRSTLYPDTICGVVYQGQLRRTGCQFSFTCDGRADVPKDKNKWRITNELAKRVTTGESWLGDIGYATHYHANYVKPRWRRELNKVKQVGRHIFYRVKGKQIDDVLKEENPTRGLALSGNG
jgi:spore germination cell wall hydrolase CwlJ-like protein